MLLPLTLLLALPASLSPVGEPPGIVNVGRLETRSAASGLERLVRDLFSGLSGRAWVGYAVPGLHRLLRTGAGWTDGGRDREACGGSDGFAAPAKDPAPPEGGPRLRILFEVDGGQLRRVLLRDEDEKIDLCGQPLFWLTGVAPAESVSLLASLLRDDSGRLAPSVLAALALHADPSAVDVLLGLARRDPSARLRGQALFWLAQRAGERATAGIRDALADDPEIEVKKKAVFALSQLPKDEGIPLLIHTARSHPNPAVRRQAFFWLGQSKDPRALAYFEEVLLR